MENISNSNVKAIIDYYFKKKNISVDEIIKYYTPVSGYIYCIHNEIYKFYSDDLYKCENTDENNNIYKEDYSLNVKVKKWREDYLKMLIEKYDVNYVYSCPKEIEEASQQYLNDNNEVLKFVREFFTFTNNQNDFILLKDIKELYKGNKEYEQSKLKELKNHLEKTMNTTVHERKKINNKDYRGVIIGWTYNEVLDHDN